MPSYVAPRLSSFHQNTEHNVESERDQEQHVFVSAEYDNEIAEIHRAVTNHSVSKPGENTSPHLADLEKYIRAYDPAGPQSIPLSVCFKDITTYGQPLDSSSVKTLGTALWRTLTFQDVYEATLKKAFSRDESSSGHALIRDFSGVVRNGEMMLVLGNPGSGCSTFLRTIANDHASFLRVDGSLDYSGLSPREVARNFRSSVIYVPEEDTHLPNLTVHQTLNFALQNNTPKKWRHEIPRFLQVFARAFGMSHVMDTKVGNSYIRGVSGGERKRVSILESLASNSSVNAWDGSTRGLDASSALDYIRSLRILTDACERATIVSIYQASDAVYSLMDKVMLISQGRMLYQGPAAEAELYFNQLGYHRLPRQTMSDFLTSVSSGDLNGMPEAQDPSVPKGAVNLEQVFRQSRAFANIQTEIEQYESSLMKDQSRKTAPSELSINSGSTVAEFKGRVAGTKSRFVSSHSSYTTSFFRQSVLCSKREFWHLRNHIAPLISKLLCVIVSAFLIGSMFYNMPNDTSGVYSRGGFCFYSSVLVAWFQIAELENSFMDRDVVTRQKRYAMVRPSAVVLGKTTYDFVTVVVLAITYSLPAYFLSGMRAEPGAFFTFFAAIIMSAFAFTVFYRVFAAASSRLEIALRYCGLLLLTVMVCGGYVRPINRLISEVPWVGWLAYLTPALYTYEIIMATEFHNRDFSCAVDAIIPQGSSYQNSAFQGCAYRGVGSGQLSLNGDAYITQEFGFSFNNVGRDFGILFVFLAGLLLINMLLAEGIDWSARVHGGAEYARKSMDVVQSKLPDEENAKEIPNQAPVTNHTPSPAGAPRNLSTSASAFTWRDIDYYVPHMGQQKQLLHKVSGFCESGKLTALVGPSGAGKTTLLSTLTNQASGTLTGTRKINDQLIGPSFGQEIGYCQQMDIHIETSTVREAFEFSAFLRQRTNATREERLVHVDSIIETLGMTELQNVLIRSLSLEQKKRTTIGVELCAKPNLLLFLDEPTSGLDSQGAMSIVRLLRRLADGGQAIICTIHQASQEQFELFDRALAVYHGHTYYFGTIHDIVKYFSKHQIHPREDQNVADFLIDVTTEGSGNRSRDLSALWEHSLEASMVLESIDDFTSTKDTADQDNSRNTSSEYAASTIQQTLLLTKRTMIQYWRTPDYIYSRLYCSFFHSLLNGLIFLQLGNTVADLQYRIFACFLILMIVPEFISACAMMFDDNRNVWLGREYPSRVYGWVAFSSSQIIAEIPWAFAGGVVFYIIFYFLVGLPLGVPAGYTFIMMILFHQFSTSWGQWIAALSTDAAMAASIMPFFVIMCEFFNGVLQPQRLMPSVWAYTMYYVGPFTYWISGIVAQVLTDVPVQCQEQELSRFQPPAGQTCGDYAQEWLSTTKGYLSNPNSTASCGYCEYAVGQDYLSTIGVTRSDAWPYLAIFAMFTITNYLSVYFWVYVKSVKNWLPW